jgi:hypothetical protein
VVDPDHETIAAPKLNVVAISQLFCPNSSICIGIAYESSIAGDVPVLPDDVSAVLTHLGDANHGEVTCEGPRQMNEAPN